jgi:hypothetical protein
MWPDTRTVVRDIWNTLPTQFRINHTAYAEPRLDDEIWEMDTSVGTMECIRSQDVLPVLDHAFSKTVYVPYQSICRRFLSTMYGPNYDLSNSLHKAILDWLWQLDIYYVTSQILHPETYFGIYSVPAASDQPR